MPEYNVYWEIQIEADTPQEAARIAYTIQQDPNSIATIYTVTPRWKNSKEGPVYVDLLEGIL